MSIIGAIARSLDHLPVLAIVFKMEFVVLLHKEPKNSGMIKNI
jgi:hypothetical protein